MVEFPAATDPEGFAVTVKSPALAPVIVIDPTVKLLVPVFSIVNVFGFVEPATDIEPKSVSSATFGVVSPSAIDTALPITSISGPLQQL